MEHLDRCRNEEALGLHENWNAELKLTPESASDLRFRLSSFPDQIRSGLIAYGAIAGAKWTYPFKIAHKDSDSGTSSNFLHPVESVIEPGWREFMLGYWDSPLFKDRRVSPNLLKHGMRGAVASSLTLRRMSESDIIWPTLSIPDDGSGPRGFDLLADLRRCHDPSAASAKYDRAMRAHSAMAASAKHLGYQLGETIFASLVGPLNATLAAGWQTRFGSAPSPTEMQRMLDGEVLTDADFAQFCGIDQLADQPEPPTAKTNDTNVKKASSVSRKAKITIAAVAGLALIIGIALSTHASTLARLSISIL